MRHFILLMLCCGCSGDKADPPEKQRTPPPDATCGPGLACDPGEICLQGQCVPGPDAPVTPIPPRPHLTATPELLSFGNVAPGTERRLSVVLENDGEAMLTVDRIAIAPDGPFRLETLGTGPFWIRPGRSRNVFVTCAGGAGAASGTLRVGTAAPEIAVELRAE